MHSSAGCFSVKEKALSSPLRTEMHFLLPFITEERSELGRNPGVALHLAQGEMLAAAQGENPLEAGLVDTAQ